MFELLPIWSRRKQLKSADTPKIGELVSHAPVAKVEEEPVDVPSWTLHPQNPFRTAWDLSSLALVMYDIVFLPLLFFDLNMPTFLSSMAWITRFFWTFDIPLTFLSGYVTKSGHIERHRPTIARQYLRTWFPLDLLIVILDWLECIIYWMASGMSGVTRLGKITRIFRLIRMVRLLRLAKIGQIVFMLVEQLSSERLRIAIGILKYVTLMLISGHVFACLWYFVGTSKANEGWTIASDCLQQSQLHCYVVSFRWSLAQFGGGMDEIVPTNLAEHVAAVFAYMIAFWFGAALVSTLTSLITQFLIEGSHSNGQIKILRKYLEQNKISKHLAVRLTRNARWALLERRQMVHEEFVEIVGMLSEPLRMELRFEIYGPSLSAHPFFELWIVVCPAVTKRICHKAMSMMLVAAGDIVFDAGEIPTNPRMYIINHGLLDYGTQGGHSLEVGKSSWVAEPALWVSWTHRGILTATEDSRLYTLDAREFQAIASHFEYGQDFDPRVYAERVATHLNSMDARDVTDIVPLDFITGHEWWSTSAWKDENAKSHWLFKQQTKRQMAKVIGRGT